MNKFFKSFKNALHGLRVAWREEHNFRIEVILGVLVLVTMIMLRFSWSEFIPVIIMIVLVIMAEIMNTAIEDLGDIVEPKYNPMMGKVKDLTAAFVLVASIGAGIVGVIVFVGHFL